MHVAINEKLVQTNDAKVDVTQKNTVSDVIRTI